MTDEFDARATSEFPSAHNRAPPHWMLEVRCCCNAGKLYGYLPMPPDQLREGATYRYRCAPGPKFTEVQLHVAKIHVDVHEPPFLAIKSDDIPLETLRKIRTFVEAAPGEDSAPRFPRRYTGEPAYSARLALLFPEGA